MFNPLKINVMKKEIDLKNKENYATPEVDIVELATECVMTDTSQKEDW